MANTCKTVKPRELVSMDWFLGESKWLRVSSQCDMAGVGPELSSGSGTSGREGE